MRIIKNYPLLNCKIQYFSGIFCWAVNRLTQGFVPSLIRLADFSACVMAV